MDNRKSRSSLKYCDEGLACKVTADELPIATVYCRNCRANLCVDCDEHVHPKSEFFNHDRDLLIPPPSDQLCKPVQGECKKRNYADLRCRQCDASLCYDCDTRVHQRGAERQHIRTSFKEYSVTLAVNGQRAPAKQTRSNEDQRAGNSSNQAVLQPVEMQPKSVAGDQKSAFSVQRTHESGASSQVHRALKDAFRPQHVQPTAETASYVVNADVLPDSSEFYSLSDDDMLKKDVPQSKNTNTSNKQASAATSAVQQQNASPNSKRASETARAVQPEFNYRNLSKQLQDALEDDGSSPHHPRNFESGSVKERVHTVSKTGRTGSNSHFTDVNLTDVDLTARSVQLLSASETLQPKDCAAFCDELGFSCSPQTRVKVVSIVGNTGDGKSFTLNRLFFPEAPAFKESEAQSSCTIGVCAALCPATAGWLARDRSRQSDGETQQYGILALDTEGLLGVGGSAMQRMRMLLKVMAISDVVICRTRAERLHADTFAFLADAGRAYSLHFERELERVRLAMSAGAKPAACATSKSAETVGKLGPILVVFHETLHTEPLASADHFRASYTELGRDAKDLAAFSKIDYVGVRSDARNTAALAEPVGVAVDLSDELLQNSASTAVSKLAKVLRQHVANDTVRKPRCVAEVWRMLEAVNNKFGNVLDGESAPCVFPESYFACTVQCEACGARCTQSLNHDHDYEGAQATAHCTGKNSSCKYVKALDNRMLLCRSCISNGTRNELVRQLAARDDGVMAGVIKYMWAGYTLECRKCGVVFREREYWMNNPDPADSDRVHVEIVHCWSDGSGRAVGGPNVGRTIVDQVEIVGKKLSSVAGGPTQKVMGYIPGLYAPDYWVPNADIRSCCVCAVLFADGDQKHHCRKCGQGVCTACSTERVCVPERGWHEPVRVCDRCKREKLADEPPSEAAQADTTFRRVGETVEQALRSTQQTIGRTVQEFVRPNYWKADSACHQCFICANDFGPKRFLHHCRKCGEGVCDDCSPETREVPDRGWTYRVRVCNKCLKLIDDAKGAK